MVDVSPAGCDLHGMPVDLDTLVDALTDTSDQPYGRFGIRCKTCRLIADLPPPGTDQRGDVIRSYIDGKVEAETVAKRLNTVGVGIGADSIRKHRRGVCKTKDAVTGA